MKHAERARELVPDACDIAHSDFLAWKHGDKTVETIRAAVAAALADVEREAMEQFRDVMQRHRENMADSRGVPMACECRFCVITRMLLAPSEADGAFAPDERGK